MPERKEQPPKLSHHYTRQEFLLIQNLDPNLSSAWLEQEGLTPCSGVVIIWIDGKKCFMSTDPKDFGTLIELSK